jgi:hypothetical protein
MEIENSFDVIENWQHIGGDLSLRTTKAMICQHPTIEDSNKLEEGNNRMRFGSRTFPKLSTAPKFRSFQRSFCISLDLRSFVQSFKQTVPKAFLFSS